jgi:hypothetical protein
LISSSCSKYSSRQLNLFENKKLSHQCIHLGNRLLKPEHFAAGLLVYLSTIMSSAEEILNSEAQLFSFSSTPTSLSVNPLSATLISPILARKFALSLWLLRSGAKYWPRVRHLMPGGQTIIVLQEIH